jgi:hypothetical protein
MYGGRVGPSFAGVYLCSGIELWFIVFLCLCGGCVGVRRAVTVVEWARSSSAVGPTATAASATTATTSCRVLKHSYQRYTTHDDRLRHMANHTHGAIPQTRGHLHAGSVQAPAPLTPLLPPLLVWLFLGERRVCELCFSLVPLRAPKYAKEQLRLSRSHTLAQGRLDPHMPLRPNNWYSHIYTHRHEEGLRLHIMASLHITQTHD